MFRTIIEQLHNFIGELHKSEFADLFTCNKTDYNNPLFIFSIFFPLGLHEIDPFIYFSCVYAHS